MNIPIFIAALIFLLSLWRTKLGLVAIILLWPTYLQRTSVFQIPTTALELSLYAVVTATIILWTAKRVTWHWIHMTKRTWGLILLWIVSWVAATAFSPDRTAALGAFKAWLIDPLLFSALLIFHIRTETDRRSVLQAAIISGTIVAVFGLYQMIWLKETLQEGRLSSFFHPVANYAAMYLVPLCILNGGLLLYRYLQGKFWWLCFGVMLLAIALTMSYGGFFSLVVGAVILWHYLLDTKLKRRLALGAVIVGILGVTLLSLTRNFSQHFSTTDRSSGQVRQQIWVTSWHLVRQHPILGIGPNNFEAAYRQELPKHYFPPLEWLVSQPHNLFFALWLEIGLFGLVAFIASVFRHVRILRASLIPQVAEKAIAIAGLAGLMAILAHGLVDTPYFKNDLAMEFMLFMTFPWLSRKKLES